MKSLRRSAKVGLIGMPVSHSLSPKIFAILGRLLKRGVDYVAIAAPAESLGAEIVRLRKQGYAGLNVTIPHKRNIMAFLDGLTPEAQAIGAVNVLRFSTRGVKGHNTDAAGFADALENLGWNVKGREAVIFGAGGAARAAGYALGRGCIGQVRICSRTKAKAEEVARVLSRLFPKTAFSSGGPKRACLWVNATPLGMKGFPNQSPAPAKTACGLAFDLVYGRNTPFLRQAGLGGAETCGGLGMLVYQAVRSLEFWFGGLGAERRMALGAEVIKCL